MKLRQWNCGWLGLLLGAAMLGGFGGSNAAVEPTVTNATTEETVTIAADGVKGITDASNNSLFTANDATKGVAELIAQGQVKINGMAVPQATGDKLDINEGKGLWKNLDGTWSWDVHVLFKGSNKPYEEAVVGFVNHATMLRGTAYTLKKVGGKVTALLVTVMDVALADKVTKGASFTTFTIVAKGDNSTNKPNPGTLNFANVHVQGDPRSQDVVLYWKDTAGWHLKRATPVNSVAAVTETVGVNASGAPTYTYTRQLDGVDMVDSRLTLQYSEPWSRPSQPFQSMAWMGENSVNVIQWQNVPGVTLGLSRGTAARAALTAAITKSRDALNAVQVSDKDGTDVAAGTLWVTSEYYTTFTKAVDDAQQALGDTALTDAQIEGALWRLAQAYGGRVGDRNSWLENAYFGKGNDYGRGTAFDTGFNGKGFWTAAQSQRGTATDR